MNAISLPRRSLAAAAVAGGLGLRAAAAATAGELQSKAAQALATLRRVRPDSVRVLEKASATLVFPEVVKGGLLVGGQYGEGVLHVGETLRGYYRIAAASFGLQAGAQSFSLAMLFMNQAALSYLDRSEGWQLGAGPSFVVADEAFARQYTSTTLTQDVVGYIFGQQGLMGGIGIEGAKIMRFTPG